MDFGGAMRDYHTTYRIGGSTRDTGMLAEVADKVSTEPKVKTASAPGYMSDAEVQKIALQMGLPGLRRVAGNVFENPANRDFWKVDGGKILRLVGSGEVDFDESLAPASAEDPESHIASMMAELE